MKRLTGSWHPRAHKNLPDWLCTMEPPKQKSHWGLIFISCPLLVMVVCLERVGGIFSDWNLFLHGAFQSSSLACAECGHSLAVVLASSLPSVWCYLVLASWSRMLSPAASIPIRAAMGFSTRSLPPTFCLSLICFCAFQTSTVESMYNQKAHSSTQHQLRVSPARY